MHKCWCMCLFLHKKGYDTGKTSDIHIEEVSFSSMGKDMQTAKTALGNTPDVRESKIQDLKRRIDNGTYDVSVDDFAQKLLDSYSKTNI